MALEKFKSPPIVELTLDGSHLSADQRKTAQSAILKNIATHTANPAAVSGEATFKLKWKDPNKGDFLATHGQQ